MFYKVKLNNNVIDVLAEIIYIKWQNRNKLHLRTTNRAEAFGILSSDNNTIFRINGLNGDYSNENTYDTVTLEEISEEEYNLIKEILEENRQYEDITDEPVEPIEDEDTVKFAKETKIDSMDKECYRTIVSGFDLTLSDELSHHFSLQITDQLKIEKLYNKAMSGEESLPYHADGEEFKFYSSEDIILIHTMMEYVIDYNTTYFNSLREYIRSLNTLEDINSVCYGTEIPEEYQSEVFKSLLSSTTGTKGGEK